MKAFKKGILVVSALAAILQFSAYAAPSAAEDSVERQIYMEISLIEASGGVGEAEEFPAEIEKVVEKLRGLFKFPRYRIIGRADAVNLLGSHVRFSSPRPAKMDSHIRQTIPPRADVPQRRVTLPSGQNKAFFEVSARMANINGDLVSLADLEVNVLDPRSYYLKASVNIRDGETLVLGASRGDTSQEALIVIVTVKLIKTAS